jgi:hypothetical protein
MITNIFIEPLENVHEARHLLKNLIIKSCDLKITMVQKIKFCPVLITSGVTTNRCKRVQLNRNATVNQFQIQTAPVPLTSVERNT